jgi:hypothetical protein
VPSVTAATSVASRAERIERVIGYLRRRAYCTRIVS